MSTAALYAYTDMVGLWFTLVHCVRCMKAGLKKSALEHAQTLMRPEHRSLISETCASQSTGRLLFSVLSPPCPMETSLALTALPAATLCRFAPVDKRKIEGMVRKGAKTADETHDPDEVRQL